MTPDRCHWLADVLSDLAYDITARRYPVECVADELLRLSESLTRAADDATAAAAVRCQSRCRRWLTRVLGR